MDILTKIKEIKELKVSRRVKETYLNLIVHDRCREMCLSKKALGYNCKFLLFK